VPEVSVRRLALAVVCALTGSCGGSSPAAPTTPQTPAPSSCTYSVNPSSVSFVSQGGTGVVKVTTGAGCAWTAASTDSWITITSGAAGTGTADISYSVGNNLSLVNRVGRLTVGGQPVTIMQAGPAMAGCTDTLNADAFGGVPFITFLDPISYGCRIVNAADGHPVHDGSQSARFELRANECNASPASPDCQTDRSRYEVFENNRGTSTDGRIVTYELWVYIPAQPRIRPRGGNLLFLDQIQYLPPDGEAGGVLAYLEVGSNGELMIRTHRGFTFDIQQQYTVVPNPAGTWNKIVWEIKSTTTADGYVRVYANDVLRVDETKPTLPNAGWRHSLKIGIYNAFKSQASEPYDTQVVYFDGIKTSK
jgi:polysaccharide lyase-like protein